jgi:hypothetical protein
MTKAQARRSRKNEGKYRAQFAVTERNKRRRMARRNQVKELAARGAVSPA